ncbi:class IV lanthionine synthetase LanL [Streptomyces sp. MUM 203J]|uniref:class IV lanthionine synthetase LanL n=1 Tax=Streptomyces sp. MUM 203J TaxID=2791990 RepID=UPI001F050254|nr:class IV lanthionine synthetase LanL [Streptomyces sp. MUM 203J]MCH0539261.1 class IV lanthionine synthetase LanL [Streptomyces sp. MUM 203J]
MATALSGHPYQVSSTAIWVHARHENPIRISQGWKLHLSARPATLVTTLEHALPVLVAFRCHFKAVRSIDVLRDINSVRSAPGSVGKAVTVYPPQDSIRETAEELARVLAGFEGPRIRSDRLLRRGSPVFYRYGPFAPRFRALENGDVEPALVAPDGTLVSGVAGPRYTAPDWVRDPFRETPAPGPPAVLMAGGECAEPLLGGRYRVTAGLARTARGIVCRARETRTGRRVVIKQAYTYVSEGDDGADATDRLRHERRILEALAGVAGVPQYVDHFAHSDSEFLVTTDVGGTNLALDVDASGTYDPAPTPGGRSLPMLASGILTLLDAVHGRGVVVRDLAPKNIVLGESGALSLVDFEISRFRDRQYHGWTPGYAAPGQSGGAEAVPEDDYFSLGATLFHAAVGIDPVCIHEDVDGNISRTRRLLADALGPAAGPMAGIVSALLDTDPGTRREAAAALRGGPGSWTVPPTRRTGPSRIAPHASASPGRPPPHAHGPLVAADVLDDAALHCVRELVDTTRALLRSEDHAPRCTNVYQGSAGIGTELLHHLGVPGVPEAVTGIAWWTARHDPAVDRPRGLYFGSMGTAVFLAAAGRALDDGGLLTAGLELADRTVAGPRDDDLEDHIHGLAGIGTGHLILYRLTGERRFATAAERCGERIATGRYRPADPGPFPDRRDAGIDTRFGFGHGKAGTAAFLASCAAVTGNARLASVGRAHRAQVLAALPPLVAAARTPRARPMCVSWCQGFAGIGGSLARVEGPEEPDCVEAARLLAQVSVEIAPRVPLPTQCCGLAGAGEFLLDMAGSVPDPRRTYLHQAHRIARHILTRCGGSDRRPVVPGPSLVEGGTAWATGSAGVLSFLRRLRGGGSRLWTSGWCPPERGIGDQQQ